MDPADMARLHAAAFVQARPWSVDEFAALLNTPGTFAVGDARAFALARVIVDEAELLTLATDPDHRRQGLARRVMDGWHAEAARRGAASAYLEVASDNIAALSLYRDCGYDVTGRRPEYYPRPAGKAADALQMTKQI